MTASKLTLTTAALIAGLCIPAGYTAHRALDSGGEQATAFTGGDSTVEIAEQNVKAESEIAAEWRRLREQFGEGPDALPRLYDAIEALPDALRRRAFHTLLPIEWASVDPSRAMIFFRSAERPVWQSELFIEEWSKLDPSNALDTLIASGSGWERLMMIILPQIAETVPHRLVEVVSQLPREDFANTSRAFAIFAESDPVAAARAVHDLPAESLRGAYHGVARGWAKRDPQGALAWARSLEHRDARNTATTAALWVWASNDPLPALDHLDLAPPNERLGAEIMRKAAGVDFEATLNWVRDNPAQISTAGLAIEVGRRLEQDPIRLLAGFESRGILPAMLSSLYTQDSLCSSTETQTLVWQWLLEPERSADAALLRESMIWRADYADPMHLMTLVDQLPNGSERERMMRDVASGVIAVGELFSWSSPPVSQHRSSGERLDVNGVHELITAAPAGWRTTLIDASFAQLSSQQFAQSEQLSTWIDRVAGLGDDLRAEGIQKLSGALAVADPEGMEQFYARLPDAGEREAAAIAFMRESDCQDPAATWPWLERINPSSRHALVSELLSRLVTEDQALARHWLDQAPVTPAERDDLIRNLSLEP